MKIICLFFTFNLFAQSDFLSVSALEVKTEVEKLSGISVSEAIDYLNSNLSEVKSYIKKYDIKKTINNKCPYEPLLCQALMGRNSRESIINLYMFSKYNVDTTSVLESNNPKLIDLIFTTISLYPAFIFTSKGETLEVSSLNRSDGDFIAVFQDWKLSIYRNFYDYNNYEKISYLFHEFAHYFGNLYELDTKKIWHDFSNWKWTDQGWGYSEAENFLSKYSKESPYEDFAEYVSAYRFSPNKAYGVSSQKYLYLKKYLFYGNDYRAKPLGYKTDLSAFEDASLSRLNSNFMTVCIKGFFDSYLEKSSLKFKNCLEKNIVSFNLIESTDDVILKNNYKLLNFITVKLDGSEFDNLFKELNLSFENILIELILKLEGWVSSKNKNESPRQYCYKKYQVNSIAYDLNKVLKSNWLLEKRIRNVKKLPLIKFLENLCVKNQKNYSKRVKPDEELIRRNIKQLREDVGI